MVERYGLGISPATVRNEMAVLEELGYLTHPHTSAGRVPTERGYRYFVERLMEQAELPAAECRMIRHQFHQARPDLEQWLRLAASVLARTVRSAALVSIPRMKQCRFKHLELIATHGPMVLLVLVLEGGLIKQQMLTLDAPISQEALTRAANRLNEALEGKVADQVDEQTPRLPPFEAEIAELVRDIMRRVDAHSGGPLYRDGLIDVLSQPEFRHLETLQRLLILWEQQSFLEQVLSEFLALAEGGVQVIIGGEQRWEELSPFSMVLARYGVSGQATGVLGVLGPTRMAYGRAISAVRYVSNLMSELLRELYG